MNEGLSAGDILALSRNANDGNNNNDGYGMAMMWQNPFIYLVWLAVLGNGGLFGNRNSNLESAFTRSDMFEGFNNQDVNSQLRGITNGICDGFYGNANIMNNGFNSVGREVLENRYTAKECCCETNRNIDAVRAENYRNTCEITTAIHSEGEATRALINQNTIQELRDRLEQRDREIMVRDVKIDNQAQSAYLLNEIRPCAKPAYITCSPYEVNNNFGTCRTCNGY